MATFITIVQINIDHCKLIEEAKNGLKWSINLHYGIKMAIFRFFQKCYLEFKRL